MAELNEPITEKARKKLPPPELIRRHCHILTPKGNLFSNESGRMSLIEEYYELNEAEEVSAAWKALPIAFYVCAACLGLWCGYTLAILRLRFDDRCYLFSEVTGPASRDDEEEHNNVIWESDTWCDYYQYTMVSSFIVAIIWATFFLMCGKGGKSLTGLPQPWRIVWASLIFNLIYFIIALTTAIKIQQGTDYFCARQDLDRRSLTKSYTENCDTLVLLLKKDIYLTSVQLEIVVKTSWGCAASWLILFLLSLFRIIFVVDFHMYKICVFRIDDSIQNKKEEVLRITNYEEPKQLNFEKFDERQLYHSTSAEALEELEAGNKKKTKVDKKSMRQYFNAASRSPLNTNAAFYVMADIRTLNREKKRMKSSKELDDSFDKSKTHLEPELTRTIKIHSDLNVGNSYQYPEVDSTVAPRNMEAKEDWDERSESGNETFFGNVPTNASLRIKKRL